MRRTLLIAMLSPVKIGHRNSTTIVRSGALTTIAVFINGAARFLISTGVGRLGGPAVLGQFQSALSTAQLLALLWPTATGGAASKFVARARGKADVREASEVASQLAKRTVQTGFALSLLAIPVWLKIGDGTIRGALCVALLVAGLSGYSFTRGLQFGARLIPRLTCWDIFTTIVGATGVAIFLMLGVRGELLLIPLAANYMIFAIAGWPWGERGKPDKALRREIDGFMLLTIVGTIASTGFFQLSMILAQVLAGTERAGQYAAAFTLATPASIVAASLSLVLFPSLSEAWGRGDAGEFKRQTHDTTAALMSVMVALFGTMILVRRPLVRVVWGSEFDGATKVLPYLLFAILISTLAVPSVNSLTSRSQRGVKISAISSVSGMAIGLATWAILAPAYGIVGIAAGFLVGTTFTAAVPVAVVWRTDDHEWLGLLKRLTSAVLLLLIFMVAQLNTAGPYWLDAIWAWAFVLIWGTIMRAEFSKMFARFSGRTSLR